MAKVHKPTSSSAYLLPGQTTVGLTDVTRASEYARFQKFEKKYRKKQKKRVSKGKEEKKETALEKWERKRGRSLEGPGFTAGAGVSLQQPGWNIALAEHDTALYKKAGSEPEEGVKNRIPSAVDPVTGKHIGGFVEYDIEPRTKKEGGRGLHGGQRRKKERGQYYGKNVDPKDPRRGYPHEKVVHEETIITGRLRRQKLDESGTVLGAERVGQGQLETAEDRGARQRRIKREAKRARKRARKKKR